MNVKTSHTSNKFILEELIVERIVMLTDAMGLQEASMIILTGLGIPRAYAV